MFPFYVRPRAPSAPINLDASVPEPAVRLAPKVDSAPGRARASGQRFGGLPPRTCFPDRQHLTFVPRFRDEGNRYVPTNLVWAPGHE
jgi:hypothetical protein